MQNMQTLFDLSVSSPMLKMQKKIKTTRSG